MINVLDIAAVRNTPVLRKGLAFAWRPMARVERLLTGAEAYLHRPVILVNSLPKSGTHLLLQLARALPESRYRGGFLASGPSLTQRQRSPEFLARRLRQCLPGECLGGHLYHSDVVDQALADFNAVSLFICRDPRDVLISELHYLTDMNRWHRMHRHFARLPDFRARLRLALDGFDDRYPECNARMLPYAGWLRSKNTLALRYEDLRGAGRDHAVGRIMDAFQARGGRVGGPGGGRRALADRLRAAMDPAKSHTFRRGGSGTWRQGLPDALAGEITARLAPSLAAFGYDPDPG